MTPRRSRRSAPPGQLGSAGIAHRSRAQRRALFEEQWRDVRATFAHSESALDLRRLCRPADENIRYGELSGRDGIAVSGAPFSTGHWFTLALCALSKHSPTALSSQALRAHRAIAHTAGSKAELMIAKELAKDKWGRWGGREGKMARIAEAEAKAAAEMGLQPPPRSAFAPGDGGEESSSGSDSDTPPPKKKKGKEKKMKKKAPPSDAEEEEPAGKSGKAKGKKRSRGDAADSDDDAGEGGKKDKKRKKQAKAADTSDDDADASRGADGPAGPSGGVSGLLSQAAAWWGKYFVHAGNLEGLRVRFDLLFPRRI